MVIFHLTTDVIIDGDFDTNGVLPQGRFNACSLTVTLNNSLTISNTDFVSVENDAFINGSIYISNGGYISVNNDITINGTFIVDYEGSVVQDMMILLLLPDLQLLESKQHQ